MRHTLCHLADRCRSAVRVIRHAYALGRIDVLASGLSHRRVFQAIFETNAWGCEESVSGTGSTMASTARLRERLPSLFQELGVDTLLDLPCGDFNWMKTLPLPRHYIGADIVAPLIARNQAQYAGPGRQFLCLDILRDPLPQADLLLCRDLLVHFSHAHIRLAVRRVRESGIPWLLTTHFTQADRDNPDIVTGDWRPINLCRPPFNFPDPVEVIDEGYPGDGGLLYRDKSLGLWRVADLPDLED